MQIIHVAWYYGITSKAAYKNLCLLVSLYEKGQDTEIVRQSPAKMMGIREVFLGKCLQVTEIQGPQGWEKAKNN